MVADGVPAEHAVVYERAHGGEACRATVVKRLHTRVYVAFEEVQPILANPRGGMAMILACSWTLLRPNVAALLPGHLPVGSCSSRVDLPVPWTLEGLLPAGI